MEEARKLCAKIGGHVLALETKEEMEYIRVSSTEYRHVILLEL